MKKMITILVTLFTLSAQAYAMSYEQAREYALFLTDKMAYELNLSDEQYEAAYEINLDYLMSIDTYDDLYGVCWTRRNLDLSYVLLSWQYNAYVAASYFYRPLVWRDGFWRFPVYVRYPHRTYLYFGRPHFVTVYHGAHSWRVNGGRSWYKGRSWHGTANHGGTHFGMRDRYDRGDFGHGGRHDAPKGNVGQPGSVRPGKTPDRNTGHRVGGVFGNGRKDNASGNRVGTGSYTPGRQGGTGSAPRRGFGTRRSGSGSQVSRPAGSGVKSSTRVTVGQNRPSNTNRSFRSNTNRSSSSSVSSSRGSAGKSSATSRGGGGKFGGGRK